MFETLSFVTRSTVINDINRCSYASGYLSHQAKGDPGDEVIGGGERRAPVSCDGEGLNERASQSSPRVTTSDLPALNRLHLQTITALLNLVFHQF